MSDSLVSASINTFPAASPAHLSEGEEVYGCLGNIRTYDEHNVIAQIGSRQIILPANIRLPAGAGQIFVLKLGGMHLVRRLP